MSEQMSCEQMSERYQKMKELSKIDVTKTKKEKSKMSDEDTLELKIIQRKRLEQKLKQKRQYIKCLVRRKL